MRRAVAILLVTASVVSASPVYAADSAARVMPDTTSAAPDAVAPPPIHFGAPFRPGVERRLDIEQRLELPRHINRGALLPSLYVSIAALNAFDAWSTSTAVSAGAREANPVMAPIAGNPTAMWLVKGAATASAIVVAERLWKSGHRGKAVATMIALNGVMAAVAAQNAAVLRSIN